MKRNLSIKYALLLLTGMTTLSAAAQRTYTLEECLQLSLENNVRIKNARNDMQISEQERKEAFTKYFPSISASGAGFVANKGLVEMELAPMMQMSMAKDGITAGISAGVPLFAGGQIVNANKLSRVDVEASRLQYRQSENEVRLTTESYFWQIVMLKEKQRTLTVVETQLDTLYKDAEASVEAGIATRNDLLQVQLKRNEVQSQRIQIENALNLSRMALSQYIGAESDSLDVAFILTDSLPLSPERLFVDPRSALAETNEYRLLCQNVKATRLQKKMAIGKHLPTVAIGGAYAYDNITDHDHPFWIGFATVSVPLSDWWGGAHSIRKHKLQVMNAENTLNDNSEQLIIRMQQTWNDMNDAYKQVVIAHSSIEQAEENLRLNTDYYLAGTCTMNDWLDAQSLYQQSRDKYIESYAGFEIKKREYLQATGR